MELTKRLQDLERRLGEVSGNDDHLRRTHLMLTLKRRGLEEDGTLWLRGGYPVVMPALDPADFDPAARVVFMRQCDQPEWMDDSALQVAVVGSIARPAYTFFPQPCGNALEYEAAVASQLTGPLQSGLGALAPVVARAYGRILGGLDIALREKKTTREQMRRMAWIVRWLDDVAFLGTDKKGNYLFARSMTR